MKRNSLTKQDDTENSEEQLPSIEQIIRLAQRLKKDRSDTKALKQLRWALRKHPSSWRRAGDLARLAAKELAKQVAGGDRLRQEEILAGMERVKQQLGYEESPMTERLLIEQVATCWLHYQITLFVHSGSGIATDPTDEKNKYWDKRLSKVERRLQRAIKTLERVRKMARGRKTLQVNVGEQQVIQNE